MSKILVAPVAFNECEKLRNVIKRFIESSSFSKVDYLIVDDGSDDGTDQVIREFESRGIQTLRHEKRKGVGAAIRTAISYAIENHYTALVIMAGNDKDDPNQIPLLLDPIVKNGFDLVQGSRYLKGGGAGGDMPFYRKMATRLHPFLFSLFTGAKVTDSTNGFRAMRLGVFKDTRINIHQDWLNHYELEPYILFKAIKLGYKFKEVPVIKIYPPKKMGYTKMRPVTGWWSILKPIFYLGFGIKK